MNSTCPPSNRPTRNRRGICSCVARPALVAIFGLAAFLASCARVTVHKVPTPTQYVMNGKSTWSLELQKKADDMEGVRFYLPRPFINVFESFPIATDLYIAKGRVSADGKYVVIDAVLPVTTRGDFSGAATELSKTAVPTSFIHRESTAPSNTKAAADLLGAISPRAATDTEVKVQVADAAKAADDAKKAAVDAAGAATEAKVAAAQSGTKTETAAPTSATTGINRQSVTNNNGAFAFTPLRGNFDLVYLPDFDEQYVVTSHARLGNAEFQMNLGQGWSLQGFNSLTDNSELNKRIFSLIDTASQLATKAATAGLASVFPAAGFGAVADSVISPRSATDVMKESPGNAVALKIVVVHYAAKGLYPVIKPRELYDRTAPGLVLDVTASGGTNQFVLPTPDMVRAVADRLDLHQRRFTVPVYPYQYISFNTFRYMAIQVLKPDGAPFGDLYDKTGTTGDPGDRQSKSMTEMSKELWEALAKAAGGGGTSQNTEANDKLEKVLDDLEAAALTEVNTALTPTKVEKIELEVGQTSTATTLVVKATPSVATGVKLSTTDTEKMKAALKKFLEGAESLKPQLGKRTINVQVATSIPVNGTTSPPSATIDKAKIKAALDGLNPKALTAANTAIAPKTLQSLALAQSTETGAELTIIATPTLATGTEALLPAEETKVKDEATKVVNASTDEELKKLRNGKDLVVAFATASKPVSSTTNVITSPDAAKQKAALVEFARTTLPAMRTAVAPKTIQAAELQPMGSSLTKVFISAVLTLGAGSDGLTDQESQKITDVIGPGLVQSKDEEIKKLVTGRTVTVQVATKSSG